MEYTIEEIQAKLEHYSNKLLDLKQQRKNLNAQMKAQKEQIAYWEQLDKRQLKLI